MTESIFSEDFKTQPYWWDMTPRPEPVDQVLPHSPVVLLIVSESVGLNFPLEPVGVGLNTLLIPSLIAAGVSCTLNSR